MESIVVEKDRKSLYLIKKDIAQRSGNYAYSVKLGCSDNCILFLNEETECSVCNSSSPPRKHYYFPLIPRLQKMYEIKDVCKRQLYRAEYIPDGSYIRDIFDGSVYQKLKQRDFFRFETDVALGLTLDGLNLFNSGTNDTWIVAVTNMNAPPEIRSKLENMFIVAIISGPNSPKRMDSFLKPIVEELKLLENGVANCFNSVTNQQFVLHAYLLFIGGDIPAVCKALSIKGVNAVSPCRFCHVTGVYTPKEFGRQGYHYPMKEPMYPIIFPDKHRRNTEFNLYSIPSRDIHKNILTMLALVGSTH